MGTPLLEVVPGKKSRFYTLHGLPDCLDAWRREAEGCVQAADYGRALFLLGWDALIAEQVRRLFV